MPENPYHPPQELTDSTKVAGRSSRLLKPLIVLLSVASLVATACLVAECFVTYAKPITAEEMQNIYASHIFVYGAIIAALQVAAIIAVLVIRTGAPRT